MGKHITPPRRVIGIDPDNKKHGVAIYENGKLVRLEMLDLVGVIKILQSIAVDKWVVEEVTKITPFTIATYKRANRKRLTHA